MARNSYYDDDDGRVIADMSDVERGPMLIPRFDRGSSHTGQGPQDIGAGSR